MPQATKTETDTKSAYPVSRKDAHDALQEAARRIGIDPQTNSVFSLAQTYFSGLQDGDLSVADLGALMHEVHTTLAEKRCDRFREQHFGSASPSRETPFAAVTEQLEALAGQGWKAFCSKLEQPAGGIVFTAHPTFALSRDLRRTMAANVSAPSKKSAQALAKAIRSEGTDWAASISLTGEHEEVVDALSHARDALLTYARDAFAVAAQAFPDNWSRLRPALPTLATWVGYDLDGRTDIHWSQSIAFRLNEKADQLDWYAEQVSALAGDNRELKALSDRLARATALTRKEAKAFSADLTEPASLVKAANLITEANPDRVTRADEIVDTLRGVASKASTDAAKSQDLLALAAVVDALQLGIGRIHLRVNAAQIRAVLRRDMGLETEDRHLGRVALASLSEKAAATGVRAVNFADLMLEQSTARRQFMMCAQILKHIDAGSPIRFLIAEAENPATVMGALYLARQYGVAGSLDISPLFETPEALESGGRFIERLLDEPAYQSYLKERGYLSVQFGFSDAGRFIGQVAADMAIERLHNLIGRALAEKAPGLGLLIFNTHGESMGRGAYPGTFTERYNHLLTPWNRSNFARRGIPIQHEVSFQGGDGFLHYATPELAHASLAAFVCHSLEPVQDVSTDSFYTERDFSWDFYRALRAWHEDLFKDADYEHLLGDFAAGFLLRAGSRQRRRSGGPKGPRALRAISHNSALQQLGVPLNTASGIGSSFQRETDQLIDIINTSPRLRALVNLALRARVRMSLPAFRAFAEVHRPGLWIALAKRTDPEMATVFRRVSEALDDYATPVAIFRLADYLSVDLSKFDAILPYLDGAPSARERHVSRLDIHTLHAIRLAVMMHAFTIAGQLATISPRHETSARDILAMVTKLEITAAIEALREIYPLSEGAIDVYAGMTEPGEGDPDMEHRGYAAIHRDIIAPLEEAVGLLHNLGLGLTHAYGAFG